MAVARKSGGKSLRRKAAAPDPAGSLQQLTIIPTGITGLDKVLGGGLPRGRSIIVVGGAGSGKTLLATEFIVRGYQQFGETGVIISFEEPVADLAANAAGFGWDLSGAIAAGKLVASHVDLARSAMLEVGDFDLSGLQFRIEMAIKTVGARRIVLDGLNTLLASFGNEQIVRSELLHLFSWLKEKGLTILATGERGIGSWTRLGFEEYLADGLIVLENRVDASVAKRLLRVIKCRGINHGTDEYPFLIGRDGFTLFPIRAAELDYQVSTKRVMTGVLGLDEMLGGKGVYRGSTILVGGSAGTGKTSLVASFLNAACERGEKALVFTFEEAPAQIIRNMRSIGIDLERWRKSGALTFSANRALVYGLEGHLTAMQEAVRIAAPQVVAIDPISAMASVGTDTEIKSMLARLIDYLRSQGITVMMTNLATAGQSGERADLAVSSMADTWILTRTIEHNAERNYIVQVLKSRGMQHSNQLREFNFTTDGIQIVNAYIGVDGVVIGSARRAQEAKDRIVELQREAELETRRRSLAERRRAVDAQIQALEADYAAEVEALEAEGHALLRIQDETLAASEDIAQERGLSDVS